MIGYRRRCVDLGGWLVSAGIAAAVASCGPRGYQPGAGEDVPPSDTRYRAALQTGLKGDYPAARQAFVSLAKEGGRSNLGAWSLYQASLAAEAEGDKNGAAALRDQLKREYAAHPLTLRLAQSPAATPARKSAPDCGARSLLSLCREAGISATLPEMNQLCKTTREGTTLANLENAAKKKGLASVAAQVDGIFLEKHRPAGIAWVDGDHFVAFGPHSGKQAWLEDPSDDRRRVVGYEEIAARSQGMVLLCAWGKAKLPEVH